MRSQHQTDLARYFGVNFPLHVFNEAAIQASVAQGTSLAENARIFALLNMAIADALISSMELKFYYEYWRPVTAIRAGDTDGNKHTAPDPGWLPLVASRRRTRATRPTTRAPPTPPGRCWRRATATVATPSR